MSAATSLKDLFSSFLLAELWKGLMLTGRHFLSPTITVQFPEEKTPLSPRFRGLHALLEGFEKVPTKTVDYRGITLEEMDIDAILQIRPQLVMVDELAHTNGPSAAIP